MRMPRPHATLRRAATVAAALGVLAAPAGAGAAMSILYDLDPHVREIVRPSDGTRGVGPARGAHRQEGSTSHLFAGDADTRYRLGKVPAAELAGMAPAQIAATLRRQIDGTCTIAGRDYGCRSHLVTVDEIDGAFSDRAGNAGRRLLTAMRMLERPSPYGGTYASRVHFFIAPTMTAQFAAARGRHHNLGRDGKPHFPTWTYAVAAVARGGGAWLEMYHARGGVRTPFSAGEWRRGPRDFLSLYTRSGGKAERVHFVMTGTAQPPPGRLPACSGPMSCTWALASRPGANARILANGPGAYRVGDQAADWVREYNRRLP
ncbi:MAG: hypothetical protein AB1416_06555 [Actinomycetota bacterium]